jgi:hypothetical protein
MYPFAHALDKKTRGPGVDPNKRAVTPYEPPEPVPSLDIDRIACMAFEEGRVPTLVSLLVPAVCPDYYNIYSSTTAAPIVLCVNARVITMLCPNGATNVGFQETPTAYIPSPLMRYTLVSTTSSPSLASRMNVSVFDICRYRCLNRFQV